MNSLLWLITLKNRIQEVSRMDRLDSATSLLAEAVSKDPELAKKLMSGIEDSIKENKEFLESLRMKKAEDVFKLKVLIASSEIVKGMRKSMVEQIQQAKAERDDYWQSHINALRVEFSQDIQQAKAERTAEILGIVEEEMNALSKNLKAEKNEGYRLVITGGISACKNIKNRIEEVNNHG